MLGLLLLLAAGELEVEALTVDELLVEETRLSHPPALSTPGVMSGFGLAIGGAGFTVMALNANDGNGSGSLGSAGAPILRILGGITGAIGAMMLVSGMLMMSFRAAENEAGGLRLQQVRTQLDRTGRVPLYPSAVKRDQLRILEEAMPTLGPPIAWLVGGIIAVAAGTLSALLVNSPPQRMSAGIAEMSVGGILIGVSIWQMIARSSERDAIEAERRALQRH